MVGRSADRYFVDGWDGVFVMNDIELLRLAAKAAGLFMSSEWDCAAEGRGIIIGRGDGDLRPWNPFADDGEALRLAAGLSLCVEVNGMFVHADMRHCESDHGYVEENTARNDGCIFKATRRAIVRAAAVIGEHME